MLRSEIQQKVMQVKDQLPAGPACLIKQNLGEISAPSIVPPLREENQCPDCILKDRFLSERKAYFYLGRDACVPAFYRGSWCPYRKPQVGAHNEILDPANWLRANLVAVSSEATSAPKHT